MSQRVCVKLALAEAFRYAIQAASQEEKPCAPLPFNPLFIHHSSQKMPFSWLNTQREDGTNHTAQSFVPQGLCGRIRLRRSPF